MDKSENNQYELEPGWDTGIYVEGSSREITHPRGWQYLAVALAFVLIVSLMAATGDRKKELSMIQHTGGNHDEKAARTLVLENNDLAFGIRPAAGLLQSRDTAIKSTGKIQGGIEPFPPLKIGSVRLTAE